MIVRDVATPASPKVAATSLSDPKPTFTPRLPEVHGERNEARDIGRQSGLLAGHIWAV
jgi:hypothetical protein